MKFEDVKVGDLVLIEDCFNTKFAGYVYKINNIEKWYKNKYIILCIDENLAGDTVKVYSENIKTINKLFIENEDFAQKEGGDKVEEEDKKN